MYDTINASTSQSLRKLSGEQLLLLAVLGSRSMKPKIDRELDRRAHADTAGAYGFASNTGSNFAGHAA